MKYDFEQISKAIAENLLPLLDQLDVKYTIGPKYLNGCCPIHTGSDNPNALLVYYRQGCHWRCNTHHCEKTFKGTPLGLIRGILSAKNYGWNSFQDSSKICPISSVNEFLNGKIKISNEINPDKDKITFSNLMLNGEQELSMKIPINQLENKDPSPYFCERGFTSEILTKYKVSDCMNIGKKTFFQRAVVPIFDIEFDNMVGCSGRSVFDKCLLCGQYHKRGQKCPTTGHSPKWKHSHGFQTSQHLYNSWFAKQSINKSGDAIIVEGTADVWRLEEAGIHNSVAIFGTNLSNKQASILNKMGAMTLYLVLDNDDAGERAFHYINEQFCKMFTIKRIDLQSNDIGEMSLDNIKKLILVV